MYLHTPVGTDEINEKPSRLCDWPVFKACWCRLNPKEAQNPSLCSLGRRRDSEKNLRTTKGDALSDFNEKQRTHHISQWSKLLDYRVAPPFRCRCKTPQKNQDGADARITQAP